MIYIMHTPGIPSSCSVILDYPQTVMGYYKQPQFDRGYDQLVSEIMLGHQKTCPLVLT